MFTLLLHKDPVYSLLMVPLKSHPVECKESHIRPSTKRLRPQKNRGLFYLLLHGVHPSIGKGFMITNGEFNATIGFMPEPIIVQA